MSKNKLIKLMKNWVADLTLTVRLVKQKIIGMK